MLLDRLHTVKGLVLRVNNGSTALSETWPVNLPRLEAQILHCYGECSPASIASLKVRVL